MRFAHVESKAKQRSRAVDDSDSPGSGFRAQMKHELAGLSLQDQLDRVKPPSADASSAGSQVMLKPDPAATDVVQMARGAEFAQGYGTPNGKVGEAITQGASVEDIRELLFILKGEIKTSVMTKFTFKALQRGGPEYVEVGKDVFERGWTPEAESSPAASATEDDPPPPPPAETESTPSSGGDDASAESLSPEPDSSEPDAEESAADRKQRQKNEEVVELVSKGANAIGKVKEQVDAERPIYEAKWEAEYRPALEQHELDVAAYPAARQEYERAKRAYDKALRLYNNRGFLGKLFRKQPTEPVEPEPPATPMVPEYDYGLASEVLNDTQMVVGWVYLEQLNSAIETDGTFPEAMPGDIVESVEDAGSKIFWKVDPELHTKYDAIRLGLDVGFKDGKAAGLAAMAAQILKNVEIVYEDLTIIKSIGSGGSGAIVFAADYLGMAPVAFKVFKINDFAEGEDVAVAQAEAELMASFNDDDEILMASNFFDKPPRIGYAMEYAPHGDLKDFFARHVMENITDINDRLKVVKYLMRLGFSGLAKFHARTKTVGEGDEAQEVGYTHADIKAENFLLGPDLKPRLMDFGFAEAEAEGEGTGNVGTSDYMAPEVVGGHVEQKSDVWSMGEMLLELVFDLTATDIARGLTSRGAVVASEAWRKAHPELFNSAGTWINALFPDPEAEEDEATMTKYEALRGLVADLEDSAQFKSFLQTTMALNPADRATAQEALGHSFLEMTDDDTAEARGLLEGLFN